MENKWKQWNWTMEPQILQGSNMKQEVLNKNDAPH